MADGPGHPVPAVRPARPPYIEAFEKITQGKNDQIEAFVAFGLFVSSEYRWGLTQATWPTEDQIQSIYGRLLHDSELPKTEQAAKKIVDDHRENLVREHEKKYLDQMFKQIEARVEEIALKTSVKSFWRGVAEATTGAFCWSAILIVIVFGLWLFGIDLLHGIANLSHVTGAKTP
jgi:hypothetical protein